MCEFTGQREDPLAVRHVWQNAVHQLGRLFIHAPARAGRAEPPPWRGQGGKPGAPTGATARCALEAHSFAMARARGRAPVTDESSLRACDGLIDPSLRHFEAMNSHLERVSCRFEAMSGRFEPMSGDFEPMCGRVEAMRDASMRVFDT
jgi:hypothetical protein